MEMAPYLTRYLQSDPNFTVIPQESVAFFAHMISLSLAAEADTAASAYWKEQSIALGGPERAVDRRNIMDA